MNIKGNLALLILHTLSTGTKHGYLIAKEIEQKSEGLLVFSEGTLYPTLHALAKDNLIEAIEQEVDGRKRRCYHLTTAGRKALHHEREQWTQYSRVVNLVLGEGL